MAKFFLLIALVVSCKIFGVTNNAQQITCAGTSSSVINVTQDSATTTLTLTEGTFDNPGEKDNLKKMLGFMPWSIEMSSNTLDCSKLTKYNVHCGAFDTASLLFTGKEGDVHDSTAASAYFEFGTLVGSASNGHALLIAEVGGVGFQYRIDFNTKGCTR